MDIEPGKHYRVVTRHRPGGTVATVEGEVIRREGRFLHFAGNLIVEYVGDSVREVAIERLPDPLPTTPGSLIMLERDSGKELCALIGDKWVIAKDGRAVLMFRRYDVIFDAGKLVLP